MHKRACLLVVLFGVFSLVLYAKGTASGTAVENQAEVQYTLGGIDYNLSSNQDHFLVDQIIDLQVSWQDSMPVEVGAGESSRVLTFLLTNLGNGEDYFDLLYEHNGSSSFAPTGSQLYLDSDGNGVFDLGIDLPVADLNLSADANITLFVVADIPVDANGTQVSHDGILATSRGSATVGADRADQVDAVVRQGSDQAMGSYWVRDYWLVSHKSVVTESEDNATHTGTILTYRIMLSIGGQAAGRTISHVVLADTIPAGTVYQNGTLRIDGTSVTDAADGDAGSFDGSHIRANIGTLSGATHREITFDVQIQ